MDVEFTGRMEGQLDDVANGKQEWVALLHGFYGPFSEELAKAKTTLKEAAAEALNEPSAEPCDLCGKPMIIKVGRFGPFLACTGYPECKHTKDIARSGEDATSEQAGDESTRGLRNLRQANGHEARAFRAVPRLHRLPGMQRQEERPQGDRRALPEVQRPAGGTAKQARGLLRMLELPDMQVHRELASPAPAVPGMQRIARRSCQRSIPLHQLRVEGPDTRSSARKHRLGSFEAIRLSESTTESMVRGTRNRTITRR